MVQPVPIPTARVALLILFAYLKGDYVNHPLLADSGIAGVSSGRLAVVMSTPTIQPKTATHIPFEIVAKISPVSADRFTSASGHRRASFTQQAELAFDSADHFVDPSIDTVDLPRTARRQTR